MRTTLDLPENLVKNAMKLTKLKTKTAVIVAGLNELIQKESSRGIMRFKGKVHLDIDLDALRGRK